MSDYVNAAEASAHLGCSEAHIRRLISRGRLHAEKVDHKWAILRADLDALSSPDGASDRPSSNQTDAPSDREQIGRSVRQPVGASDRPSVSLSDAPTGNQMDGPSDWRDDLLAQVARLEADKVAGVEREEGLRENVRHVQQEMGLRIEASKARVVDLERAATVRESRIVDMESTHADDVAELRGQVAILEAKVREVLEARAEEIGELAKNITELVGKQQEMQTRVYELEPVASQVPMLQAAVEEKDATLSDRERELQLREHELGQVREDIEAIASRPVAGPVFRLLTKGKLRF